MDKEANHSWIGRDILLPYFATRAMLVLIAKLSQSLLRQAIIPGAWNESAHGLINAFSRWDAGYYLSIAKYGYIYTPDQQSNVAFFPLYPSLMKIMGTISGRSDSESLLVIGIAIANIALLAALVFFVALVRLDHDEQTARRAALYVLIFPATVFLSAVYPESLFLALSIGSFYFARINRWWIAGLLGGLTALSRPYGIVMVIPLLYEYCQSHNFSFSKFTGNLLAIGLVPMGFATYLGYLYFTFGNPLVFLDAQKVWGRQLVWPWETFANFFKEPLVVHGFNHSLLDLYALVILAMLIIASWRWVRRSLAIYATAMFLLIVSSGLFMSSLRLTLAIFPVFMVLAVLGKKWWFDSLCTVTFTGLASLFMAMFALWYWVG